MNNLFRLDSPLMIFFSKAADIMILSLLWLVGSIPILTIGASTTAMCFATQELVLGHEGSIFKHFSSAFKRDLKQSTVMLLVLSLLILVIGLDAYFLWIGVIKAPKMLAWLSLIPLAVIIAISSYAFPLLARFSNTTLNIIKNALFLTFSNLPLSVALCVLNLAPFVFMVFCSEYFLKTLIIWVLLGSGSICYLETILMKNLMAELIRHSYDETI